LGFARTAELIAQAAMRNYEEFLKPDTHRLVNEVSAIRGGDRAN